MLLRTGSGGAHDARVADAIELGGPEARRLLDRLAAEHGEIKELMDTFDVVKRKVPAPRA